MTSSKSDQNAGQTPQAPAKNRAAARQERLAAQLRENLKKRKEFARARKAANDTGK